MGTSRNRESGVPHFEHSELTLLLLQIGVIVVVARALTFVTRRLGQPTVIAEVSAGVLLGPSLLGWVWPDALAFIFPTTSLPLLKMFSQFGLILFMFLVGLEFDARLLKGRGRASIVISNASIAAPFAIGAGIAYVLYASYAPSGVSLVTFASFFGIAMSVTAFPVLARILAERNLSTTRLGAVAIACAAVDDVTAWCLLAFVVATARAQGVSDAIWTTALSVTFVAIMVFVVRPFSSRLARRASTGPALSPTVAFTALMLLFVSAGFTELIGIHALFGAFLAGVVLPKEGELATTLTDKLELVATTVLLPLFFAYSGLRTHIGLLDTVEEWMWTFAIIVAATVGKFGGSALAARLMGFQWREATAIGTLMNTRGLIELVVLNIGLDIGVIEHRFFTMMVLMALVTTFITTPVLKRVYPDAELARDRLVPKETGEGSVAGQELLICVADAQSGVALMRVADALIASDPGQWRITALHLRPPGARRPLVSHHEADAPTDALKPLLAAAQARGIAVRPVSFASADPGGDICRAAALKEPSWVLLGGRRPLLTARTLGGVVREVMERSPAPVAVFVDRGLTQVRRVLVACTGGAEDELLLRVARQLAHTPGVTHAVIRVVAPASAAVEGAEDAPALHSQRQSPSQSEGDADTGAAHVRVIQHESPIDGVLAEARGFDLLVLGMHARWGLSMDPLSLRSGRILDETVVSVLVVHSGAEKADR